MDKPAFPSERAWPPEEMTPILVEIGRIVFNWNNFERGTTRLLNEMIGGEGNHKVTIVTAHMGSNTQLDALRTLATEFLEGEESDHVHHIIKLFERLRERRNFYIHSFDAFTHPLVTRNGQTLVDTTSPIGMMRSLSARGRLQSNETYITATELAAEAALIHRAGHYLALVTLYFRRWDNPDYQALPEKFPLPDKLKRSPRSLLGEKPQPQS